jgi:hypothetical protein
MPSNNNKKKKKSTKNKGPNRSVNAVFCANCERNLSARSDRLTCVCTRVRFCSLGCQQQAIASRKHDCQGPPQPSTFYEGTDPRAFTLHGAPENVDKTKQELQETVLKKLKPLMLEYALRNGGRAISENQMYITLAEEGSNEAAYMAGIACRHRTSSVVAPSTTGDFDNLQVLQSDILAFKYFKQAAEGGIGLGMQSLADLYYNGQGVRASRMNSCDWLWNACLINSFKAQEILDSRSLIPLEVNSIINQLNQMQSRVPSWGATIRSGSPNLAGLLAKLTTFDSSKLQDCLLPPFAAPVPTLSVGSAARQGSTGRVLMTGSNAVLDLLDFLQHLKSKLIYVDFIYGRRDTCKGATAQTYAGTTREKDAHFYQVPPMPQCDESISDEEAQSYHEVLQDAGFAVLCVHSEAKSGESEVTCQQCIDAARDRLEAVSHGRVVLSLKETLAGRGRTAIWRNSTGELHSETFKTYCRADVESVLGALVACKPNLAHPLFIAQDPNLFWPLISYHGTIRAALEYVAPHVDWKARLGAIAMAPEQQPIVEEAEPGTMLFRCGNELCMAMEREGKEDGVLQTCQGCDSRPYCSKACIKADWAFHKHECAAGQFKTEKEPPSIGPFAIDSPQPGEAVVLQGLNAKPKLNGKVAIVYGSLNSNGRYPVQVRGSCDTIAVKPGNLQQLGVRFKNISGKAHSFKCSKHRLDFCKECCFDFTILNHLSKLVFKQGQVTKQNIEMIANSFFAQDGDEEYKREGQGDSDFPQPECHGISDRDKKALLRDLLQDKKAHEPLKDVTVAVVGLSCFSARSLPFVQPYCIPHLDTALKILASG